MGVGNTEAERLAAWHCAVSSHIADHVGKVTASLLLNDVMEMSIRAVTTLDWPNGARSAEKEARR